MAKSKTAKAEPKLPVKQLAILGVVRFAEPLALTSVFPYLPEMIRSFGIPHEEVAKWAGITSASFSIAQSFTAVFWGRTSDALGRKPTLIVGLICTMTCFILWGMSTSLAMAITVRAIHGAGNGNVGIIRTMVAEMVPEKSLQPRAFSIMPMIWSVGSVFGPSFGGFFARPAEQFPRLFGHSKFLKAYPFILPNLIACVFFLFSVVTATLFLRETLETRRHRSDWGLDLGEKLARVVRGTKASKRTSKALARARANARARRQSFVDDEAGAPLLSSDPTEDNESSELPTAVPHRLSHPPPPSSSSPSAPAHPSIFTYRTCMALLSYTLLAFHSTSYDQMLPVFLNYPHHPRSDANTQLPIKFVSGFGLGSGSIGTMFTTNAIFAGLGQFFLFPPLCQRFGTLACFRAATLVYPLVYSITPFTALIDNTHWRYAAFMLGFITKGFLGIITFPCITILLTNSAPSMKVLGTLNGFATTFSAVGRAAGPASTGAAFTWGVRRGYVIVGWWYLAFFSALAVIAQAFLAEGDGFTAKGNDGAEANGNAEELDAGGDDDDDNDNDDDDGIEDGYSAGDGCYDDYDDYEEALLVNSKSSFDEPRPPPSRPDVSFPSSTRTFSRPEPPALREPEDLSSGAEENGDGTSVVRGSMRLASASAQQQHRRGRSSSMFSVKEPAATSNGMPLSPVGKEGSD